MVWGRRAGELKFPEMHVDMAEYTRVCAELKDSRRKLATALKVIRIMVDENLGEREDR